MAKMIKRKLGWVRDLPDHRDFAYTPTAPLRKLPEKVDLRPTFMPVYDQGNLGSCTANAGSGVVQFKRMQQRALAFIPSRLHLYWWTRFIQGQTNEDSGASIRNTFKALNKYGFCHETIWPYKVSTFKTKPSTPANNEAAGLKLVSYASVPQNGPAIKGALADGHPVVFGFSVFNNFQPNSKGFIPMPGKKDRVQGGHAVVIVGYFTQNGVEYAIIRNSWGKDYGINGHCYMPMAYILDPKLASDFWIASRVP